MKRFIALIIILMLCGCMSQTETDKDNKDKGKQKEYTEDTHIDNIIKEDMNCTDIDQITSDLEELEW